MEEQYLEIFLEPIRKCMDYKPKLGNASGNGVDLQGFQELYGADPFYAWIGLNSDLMYAAHKAAGGMTSIYRQIGIGCERLFRKIIIDMTAYSDPRLAEWSYTAQTRAGGNKKLSLDGRLELSEIASDELKGRVDNWLRQYCDELGVEHPKYGVVFEVRQGYKSKDSKRQNGDIDNAAVAWSKGYFPVFAIFSSQIDRDIVLRYRNSSCGILVGQVNDNPNISLFAFFDQILGFDLAGFFERNSDYLKGEIENVLEHLLSAE